MNPFKLAEVPKLKTPFGEWRLAGTFKIAVDRDGSVVSPDVLALVYGWQTPRAEVIVLQLSDESRRAYGGSFFTSYADRWQAPHALKMEAFGRLDAATLVDAQKEALARAAATLVPTLAWLYDALGVPR